MFSGVAGSEEQRQASQWALAFQDAAEAWLVCLELLRRTPAPDGGDVALFNFAAQVLHNKAGQHWSSCPSETQATVMQAVHHMVASEMRESRFPQVVTRRLCLLACSIAFRHVVRESASSQETFPMLGALLSLSPDPSSVACVTTYLELCKALPEELDDLRGANRITVADVLAPLRPRFLSIVKHVYDGDSGLPEDTKVLALHALNSWAGSTGAMSNSESLRVSLAMLVDSGVMSTLALCLRAGGDLAETAGSVLVETLSGACPSADWACQPKRLEQTQRLIAATVSATDTLLPLRDMHKSLLADDPLGVECRSLTSVVVELVGSYHPIVVTGLLVLAAQKAAGNDDVAQAAQHVYSKGSVVLGWLLDCTRSAWSLSSLTLDTWFYLAGAMEQAHPTLQVAYVPAAEEALRCLHVLCQWPAAGQDGPEDVSMGEFRRRSADTVNSLATSWPGVAVCLKCLGSVLATATTWQSAESALMLLRKVAAAWTDQSFDSDCEDEDDRSASCMPTGFVSAGRLSLSSMRHDAASKGKAAEQSIAAHWQSLLETLPRFMNDSTSSTPPRLAAAVVLLVAELKVWIRSQPTLLAGSLQLLQHGMTVAFKSMQASASGAGAGGGSPADDAAVLFASCAQALKHLATSCGTLMLVNAARAASGQAAATTGPLVPLLFQLLWSCATMFRSFPVSVHIARAGHEAVAEASAGSGKMVVVTGSRRKSGPIQAWADLLQGLVSAASALCTIAGRGNPVGPVDGGVGPTGEQVMEALVAPVVAALGSDSETSGPGAAVAAFAVLSAAFRGADYALPGGVETGDLPGRTAAATVALRVWPAMLRASDGARTSLLASDAFSEAVGCMINYLGHHMRSVVPDASNRLCQLFAVHKSSEAVSALRLCVVHFGEVADMDTAWASVLHLVLTQAVTVSASSGAGGAGSGAAAAATPRGLAISPELMDGVFKLASEVLRRNASVVLVPTGGHDPALPMLLSLCAFMVTSDAANSRAVNGASTFAYNVFTGHGVSCGADAWLKNASVQSWACSALPHVVSSVLSSVAQRTTSVVGIARLLHTLLKSPVFGDAAASAVMSATSSPSAMAGADAVTRAAVLRAIQATTTAAPHRFKGLIANIRLVCRGQMRVQALPGFGSSPVPSARRTHTSEGGNVDIG